MRNNFIKQWIVPVGLGLALALVIGGFLGRMATRGEVQKIRNEIRELRGELRARGEFIAHLQEQVEYTNTKATWLLNKIDKRRVLIPVMGGRAYKLVEIEQDIEHVEGE